MNMNFLFGSGWLSIQGWTRARISLGVHSHILHRASAIPQSPSVWVLCAIEEQKRKKRKAKLFDKYQFHAVTEHRYDAQSNEHDSVHSQMIISGYCQLLCQGNRWVIKLYFKPDVMAFPLKTYILLSKTKKWNSVVTQRLGLNFIVSMT